MTKEEKELLKKVLEKCIELSETGNDCFFEYSPHCDFYTVFWHKGGWKINRNTTKLNTSDLINVKNLKATIKKLDEIIKEVKK